MQDSSVKKLIKVLTDKNLFLGTAESCTGGLMAVAITDEPGASGIFDRGFVTYSNEAKTELLSVSVATLGEHGAVSEPTAKEMAEGVLANNSKASIGVSVTGIAGPAGGSDEKPVGLVYIGVAVSKGETAVFRHLFGGNRDEVRNQAVQAAFQHVLDIASLR